MDKLHIDINELLAGFIGAIIGTDWPKVKSILQGILTVLAGAFSAVYLTPIVAKKLGWSSPGEMVGLSFLIGTLGLRSVQLANAFIEKTIKQLSGYTLAPSGSSTGSLIVASGTAYAPGSNYTVDPNESYYAVDNGTTVSKIFRYHQSGSTWVYNTNAGAGFPTIDPTQYSNNGVLTAVPGGGSNREWSIQRVFWFPNSVIKAIVVYYGNATYATELDAIANISFETFVEAPNTSANAIYLGAIVVRNNADFTDTDSYKIQPGGLFRQVGGSGGGGSIITQTLSGLSDVLISGPTNGQALVYDSTAAKWQNKSSISASISGNAATATTASYVLQAVSASFASTASFVNPLNQNVIITGSVNITQNLISSQAYISSSTGTISGSTLTVFGSGSALPVFTVQGSQGELFSITDSLSGSLFSVNNISGLPILEVFSDNTTLIGNYIDPMLITTAKTVQTNSGSFTVYSLPTASYDTAFFEYSVKSGSNARAGTIMAIQAGSSVNFTETTTTDFGDTTPVSFTVIVTGSNMALTGSSTSGAWTTKCIVRGL